MDGKLKKSVRRTMQGRGRPTTDAARTRSAGRYVIAAFALSVLAVLDFKAMLTNPKEPRFAMLPAADLLLPCASEVLDLVLLVLLTRRIPSAVRFRGVAPARRSGSPLLASHLLGFVCLAVALALTIFVEETDLMRGVVMAFMTGVFKVISYIGFRDRELALSSVMALAPDVRDVINVITHSRDTGQECPTARDSKDPADTPGCNGSPARDRGDPPDTAPASSASSEPDNGANHSGQRSRHVSEPGSGIGCSCRRTA